MPIYYVYAHVRPDGNVFYVGKGSGIRQYQTGNRNRFWKRIRSKHGYTIKILEEKLTEENAYIKEIKWIKYYKNQGQCEANFTNGGDGVRVTKRWWNEAISKGLRGRKVPIGKQNKSYKDVISKELLFYLYIEKGMSSIAIGKKYNISYSTVIGRLRENGITVRTCGKKAITIKCITDGIEFSSINAAAKYYKLYRENIRKVLHGEYKHTGGKIFIYVPDDRKAGGSSIKGTGKD